ncbi:MAG TPA: alpha-galactosidase [Bryobacteraceae bacterium]|nr:alpha-galactosidase [Bryobacteraceae bacterium]
MLVNVNARRLLVMLSMLPLAEAQPIRYLESQKIWLLTTAHSSYAMGLLPDNRLAHIYWGGPLWRAEDLRATEFRHDISSFDPHEMLENEEFPGWGGPRFYESALKVTRENGDRDLVLHYVSHHIEGARLDIVLKDIRDDIEATLHYRVYPDTGVISRSATIRNRTPARLTIESAQSAAWCLPPGEGYRLTYLTGRWAAETQINREPIHEGQKVFESRTGHTGHNANPWFAIDTGAADEEHGSVWFGALAWSGNWRFTVEQTPYRQVRVTGGFNTFDFAYPLNPGESLDTPEFVAGFSPDGFGGASRLLHRFERQDIAPGGLTSRVRPVLYNSWEATEFRVNEPGQSQLAEKAARLGVELFVMDDGWFGARNDDHAGLGDWVVNPTKFPNGLKPLIDRVNQLGMDFGLWVEPEMVNPDSNLYRAHPDWVLNFPGRPRSELRNQLVLNLARNDVKEYIFNVLDKLASENNIRYFKWDMNRIFAEPGWPDQPPAGQRKMWVQYVLNLYDIIDRLRARHPKLEIESCSGGGGRVDLGILKRVEEVWTSDNTEAFDRIKIQQGFSQAYAAKFMSAWVTDVPNMNGRSTPLQYRFLVAMQGALGIGANLNKWSPDDAALATRMIAQYKRIRNTVQLGDLYRLGDATEYVSSDGKQAALFAFRHSQQYNTAFPTIHLQALDPKAVYTVELPGSKLTLSGAYLMQSGLNLKLKGDYDSALVILERQ